MFTEGRRTRTLVRDLTRDRVASIERLEHRPLQAWHRDASEYLIAIELLRITPRFWSAAVLSISLAPDEYGGCDAEILCPDGFPAHASVTTTLWQRVLRLARFVETNGPAQTTNVLIGIAWQSPRAWVYDSRYFMRPTAWLEPRSSS